MTSFSEIMICRTFPMSGFCSINDRPVTRILCGGGANEAKVDQTTEMYSF